MISHHSLHRLFLLLLLIVSVVSVALAFKERIVIAATGEASNMTTINAGYLTLDVVCGSSNGKTFLTIPQTNLCTIGKPSEVKTTSTGWTWSCVVPDNNANIACSAKKGVAPATDVAANTVDANTVQNTSETKNITNTATTVTPITTSTEKDAVTASDAAKVNISSSVDLSKAEIVSATESENVRSDTSKTQDQNQSSSIANGTNSVAVEAATQQESEKMYAPSEPIVILAKDLSDNKNPKKAGVVAPELKVESVSMGQNENGTKKIVFNGKALPGALVAIYVFSSDPIVITVKADDNGYWSYDLNKELADGQHEAYVAVTDGQGAIVSKSQPIAFVKTAQAVSTIPVSQLESYQSPINRSLQEYILVAIGIMSVCLVVTLALAGFLIHKNKLDERIS